MQIDRYAGIGQDATAVSDWATEVGVKRRDGTTDLAFVPSVGVFASTLTRGWRLYVITGNVYVDLDPGAAAALGTWYTVELDLYVVAATVRSLILGTASGNVLADVTTMLSAFEPWDAAVDGVFDVERFFDDELTGTGPDRAEAVIAGSRAAILPADDVAAALAQAALDDVAVGRVGVGGLEAAAHRTRGGPCGESHRDEDSWRIGSHAAPPSLLTSTCAAGNPAATPTRPGARPRTTRPPARQSAPRSPRA